jgi:hypothetical protein
MMPDPEALQLEPADLHPVEGPPPLPGESGQCIRCAAGAWERTVMPASFAHHERPWHRARARPVED